MKWFNFKSPSIEKRYFLIFAVLFILSAALLGRLFMLTIVQGDDLKEASDTKRIKEVKTTAPRGNIYDRNGRLLAGTRTTFTVQLINDELRAVETPERNAILLQLVRRLEEDGVPYQEEYPIMLNALDFSNADDWKKQEDSPIDLVVERLQTSDLIGALLRSYYLSEDKAHYRLSPFQIAVKALDQKGVFLPVDAKLEAEFSVSYIPGAPYNEGVEKHGLTQDPMADVERLIQDDESIIRKMLSHPIVREMAYNLLKDRGLAGDLKLQPIALQQDIRSLENKGTLKRNFPGITAESTAKEDFVTIAEHTVLPQLFSHVYTEEENTVVPAELCLRLLDNKQVDHGLALQVHETEADLQYKNPSAEQAKDPLAHLVELCIENDLTADIVTREDLKAEVQSLILDEGINPRILVSTWEYVYEKERKDITEDLELANDADAAAIFAARNEKYKMEIESPYEAVGVQALNARIDQIGHYGYEPLNIAYNLSDKTVAYLEETIPNNKGVQISVEPVRYYPQGTMAAHVLGYVGRIATEDELARYNEDTGYSPNDIIGKTGVEESYEALLKGKDGKEVVQVDVLGNRTQTLSKVAPIPGDNLFLTIDFDLQRVAEETLTRTLEALQSGTSYTSDWGDWTLYQKAGENLRNATSGATVVLDVNTGEVLAMANYNPYDPNLFSTGISATDWAGLFPEDERDSLAHRPLLNIATQSEIQPGSIFKLITSYAGLEKGLSPYEQIEDSGFVTIGDTDFGCWIWNEHRSTHGFVDMEHALMHSCNYYFYALALGENQTTGVPTGATLQIEDIENAAKVFGLDQPTGIEINTPQESAGQIPDPLAKVEAVRRQMRLFLEDELARYEEPDARKNPEQRTADVEKILSWLDEEELVSRQEVIVRLDEMGYNSEEPIGDNTASLTDILKFNYINQADWDITDTLNVVIGQGQNAYTPIQMANMVSTIANGGVKYKTTLFNKSMNYNNTSLLESRRSQSEKIPVRTEGELDAIVRGMELAGDYGQVGQLFERLPIEVGTKTGTAQRGGLNPVTGEPYDDYGWFVAFAPLDDPEIAMATVLFQGGSGSNAAPMTRDMIANYFKLYPERPMEEVEPSEDVEE